MSEEIVSHLAGLLREAERNSQMFLMIDRLRTHSNEEVDRLIGSGLIYPESIYLNSNISCIQQALDLTDLINAEGAINEG